MNPERLGALEAFLTKTEEAHGVYETTTLQGVYDTAWPRWYAEYAVAHGIGGLVGADLTVDDLAAFFERSWGEHERSEPKPTDPWAVYTAQRLANEDPRG